MVLHFSFHKTSNSAFSFLWIPVDATYEISYRNKNYERFLILSDHSLKKSYTSILVTISKSLKGKFKYLEFRKIKLLISVANNVHV